MWYNYFAVQLKKSFLRIWSITVGLLRRMRNQCRCHSSRRRSFFLCVVWKVFRFLRHISIYYWIHICFIRNRGIHWWARNRYHIVDGYVLSWLFIIDGSLICLLHSIPCLGYKCWFIGLTSFLILWRLLDILQAWVYVNILNEQPKPMSTPRMLFLDFIAFADVIIIFGVFAFFAKTTFHPSFCTIWQSLYYSVTTITTIGSDYSPISRCGYLLFYGEIAFGVLFLVVVIQRVLSFYRKS